VNVNDPHIWWYVTRASAVIAWVLMTLAVVWGILLSTRVLRNSDNPAWLQDLHKYLGGSSIVMVALHMVSLMLDGWLSFRLDELFVPFATDYKPIAVSLGIIAFYLLIAVQGTSLLIKKLPRRGWKAIHYSSYAALALVSFHAAFSGTDVGASWYRVVSIALIMLALVAVLLRILVRRKPESAVRPMPSTEVEMRVDARGGAISNGSYAPQSIAGMTGLLTLPALQAAPVHAIERRTMVVSQITREADAVIGVRMLPLGGGVLLPWHPGAHVTIHLPNGLQRQYSLCGDPADRSHFDIAVLRTLDSQGGSRWLHENLEVGMTLVVDGPLNHFELEAAPEYLFIAGGIGITPIKSMIESLPARRNWRLAYFGQSRTTMPFLNELLTRYPGQVGIFASDESLERIPLAALVASTTGQVYCCGPESLMSEVAALVPPHRMHLERFIPVVRAPQFAPHAVQVSCARSDKQFELEAGQNILEALESAGVPMSASCRKGVCGSCEVRVLNGTPDHLDSVMDDSEKNELGVMYPCVSGSASRTLVLDV
jgi:ferredoxin-NADP reductase/DMSO/TMAO reductase YedYZ heme-binding membrane subunit